MKLSQHVLPGLLLTAALGLGSCGGAAAVDTAQGQQAPPAPTNQPDETLVSGSGSGVEESHQSTGGGEEGGGNGGNGGSDRTHESEGIERSEAVSHESDRVGGEPIPEPTTFLLFGSGLAAAAYYRRRKNGIGDDVLESTPE